jgi:hypothetical protein
MSLAINPCESAFPAEALAPPRIIPSERAHGRGATKPGGFWPGARIHGWARRRTARRQPAWGAVSAGCKPAATGRCAQSGRCGRARPDRQGGLDHHRSMGQTGQCGRARPDRQGRLDHHGSMGPTGQCGGTRPDRQGGLDHHGAMGPTGQCGGPNRTKPALTPVADLRGPAARPRSPPSPPVGSGL